MASEPEFFSGLRDSDADREWLQSNGSVYCAPAKTLEYPPEFDPRGIIRVEDQGQFNSCVGNGASSCAEACAYLDSAGQMKVQFSRWGAYIWSQMESTGGAGSDNGAEISGAIKAGKNRGFCLEEKWPYPNQYTTRVPAGAAEAAEPFQWLLYSPLGSYDEAFEWINQGRGPVLTGVYWTSGLRDNRGTITKRDVAIRTRGRHCMFLWGWTKDGLLYNGNSHSKQWGQAGWRLTEPAAVDWWGQNCELYGVSDLKSVESSRPVIVDYGENW